MKKITKTSIAFAATTMIAAALVGGNALAASAQPDSSAIVAEDISDGPDVGPDVNPNEEGHQDADESGEAEATEVDDGPDVGPDVNPNEEGHQDAEEPGTK